MQPDVTVGSQIILLPFGAREPVLGPNILCGKPTIEIGEQDNLLPVLSTMRQGIVAGELDKLLMDAKKARPRPKRKAARS